MPRGSGAASSSAVAGDAGTGEARGLQWVATIIASGWHPLRLDKVSLRKQHEEKCFGFEITQNTSSGSAIQGTASCSCMGELLSVAQRNSPTKIYERDQNVLPVYTVT